MSILSAVLIVNALVIGDALTFRSEARVTGDVVRLSDIADLSVLPQALRDRAALTPVARLRSTGQTLSSRRMAERARAAVPALSAWLPARPDQPIFVERIGDLEEKAPTAVVAGPPSPPEIHVGDRLTIRVQVGAVLIERDVEALQSARSGREVFVRTAEGRVLSAPAELDQ